MKTRPIGIRSAQEEHDLISAYASEQGDTFSEAVRKGVIALIDPGREKGYRSLDDLANSTNIEEMELAFERSLDDLSHARNEERLIATEPRWTSDPGRWRYDFATRSVNGEMILCGGAVMTLAHDARPSAKDIDALFLMNAIGSQSLDEVCAIIEERIPSQRLTPLAHSFAQERFTNYITEPRSGNG